jgi:hypothetical protein
MQSITLMMMIAVTPHGRSDAPYKSGDLMGGIEVSAWDCP